MTNDHATNNSTPHNNASGTLSYKYKKFDVNTSFRHVSTYSHAAYDERGGYTMWDGNVAYNCKIFDRDTRITFYVRNIGDKAYLTSGNGDYYDPGRQYGIQLSYSFF
jgi:outer membrane receptor protein involved in Fe transport